MGADAAFQRDVDQHEPSAAAASGLPLEHYRSVNCSVTNESAPAGSRCILDLPTYYHIRIHPRGRIDSRLRHMLQTSPSPYPHTCSGPHTPGQASSANPSCAALPHAAHRGRCLRATTAKRHQRRRQLLRVECVHRANRASRRLGWSAGATRRSASKRPKNRHRSQGDDGSIGPSALIASMAMIGCISAQPEAPSCRM